MKAKNFNQEMIEQYAPIFKEKFNSTSWYSLLRFVSDVSVAHSYDSCDMEFAKQKLNELYNKQLY